MPQPMMKLGSSHIFLLKETLEAPVPKVIPYYVISMSLKPSMCSKNNQHLFSEIRRFVQVDLNTEKLFI